MLRIASVRVEGAHVLSLRFSDGTIKTVDVGPLLEGPVFEPLKDPEYFARVSLDPVFETVVWPNGADFAPEALYELGDLRFVREGERSGTDRTFVHRPVADR